MYIPEKLIYEKTDGGRTIIEHYYPDSAESFLRKDRKFKSRQNEKTASTSLKLKDGIWIVTDFGNDQKSRNAIGIVMLEEGNCDYKQAIAIIAAKFNITPDAPKLEFAKADRSYRDAEPDEAEGLYLFDVKETFTLADAKHIIADNVWKYLLPSDKAMDPPTKEAAALKKANEVFKAYHFHALHSYTIIKDRKASTFSATEAFPIYMFDEKDFKKIYKPKEQEKGYRFMYYGNKPAKDFMFGYQQASKAYQDLVVISDDEDEMLEEDKPKKEKKKPRLEQIILCSGGSDGLNLAMLGYLPVWMNSESAKLEDGQFINLSRMAEKVYNIPDLDKTGMREAHRLGMQHLDLYTLYLPAELKTKNDWRGNPCKDLRDYFRHYTHWQFKELFKIAYPYRFWDMQRQYNKQGEYTGSRYVPNTLYMLSFLSGNGFFRFKAETEAEKYFYIKITNNIVSEVTAKDIRDYINNFLLARHMEPELRNAFLRTTQLNESALSNLPFIEIDFTDFDNHSQWMFFKNRILRVSAEKVEPVKPAECDKFVWEKEVLPHNVDVLKDFFTITRNEEKRTYDIAIHNKECLVFRYLINASRIFWREELEVRAEGVEQAERDRYIEQHNLKKEDRHLADGLRPSEGLTLTQTIEKYRADNKFEIAGKLLTADEVTEQKHHLINKIYSIGYLLHRFKNRSRAWCVWAMDNKLTDGADSHGGSGKSLILNLISRFMITEDIPGRDDKITEDKHIFGNITQHHDFVFVDDCAQYLKFNFFFPCITGGISCNPKHGKKYTIDFKDAGKFGFASNYAPYGIDPSAERRILYMMFSDYYHYSQYDEYREERRVADDFDGKVLGDDFNETEWNLLINFFAQCLKFYLSQENKINPPMDNVNRRNLKAEMTDIFQSWADVYFSPGAGNIDKRIVRKEAFEEFRKTTKQMQWSSNKFLKSLRAWCRYNDFELNPKSEITDEKNNRIIQKVKTAQPDGTTIETTEEMLYIKSTKASFEPDPEEEDTTTPPVTNNPADEDLPF